VVTCSDLRITILTGGTGGVKLLLGLRHVVHEENINVIVNTGDDYLWNGLYVSPDVDTVIYALSDMLDLSKMWGVRDDTFNFLSQAEVLGLEKTWFKIGDRDLAMHILRTYLMSKGYKLSDICRYVCRRLRIHANVIPMTDDRVETHVLTDIGDLHIQEFLIKYRGEVEPLAVHYVGIEKARACREAIRALEKADIVIVGPSSPPVSILPILEVEPIGEVMRSIDKPKIAVMPMIGSRPIAGLTDKFLRAVGVEGSSLGVVKLYEKYGITHVVCDPEDRELVEYCNRRGTRTIVTNIVMNNIEDSIRLARTILENI